MFTFSTVSASTLSSLVTDGSLCGFGNQFRLIFVQSNARSKPAPVFMLGASNPGQFVYNVFFNGTAGTPVTLSISVPYPFVTQGTNPVQVFSSFGLQSGCFVPVNNLSSGFTVTPSTIALSNYSTQALGSSVTITVSGNTPSSGMLYVTIHLDYGLKGSLFGRIDDNATNLNTGQVAIPDGAAYAFSVTTGSLTDSRVVTSLNVFKQNSGVAGILTDQFGNPIVAATVSLYGSDGSLVSITFTDKDGYFAFSFNLTHRSTFTVQFSLGNGTSISQTITVKPNHAAILEVTATISGAS
jgi:hypothetical protein